jgi:cell division cycle 20-like protein 1 (cofactor of APC complex)
VIKFCDLGLADTVTSVAWHPRGGALAVGTSLGEVQIYDAVKLKRTATLSGH